MWPTALLLLVFIFSRGSAVLAPALLLSALPFSGLFLVSDELSLLTVGLPAWSFGSLVSSVVVRPSTLDSDCFFCLLVGDSNDGFGSSTSSTSSGISVAQLRVFLLGRWRLRLLLVFGSSDCSLLLRLGT